jgi:NADH:ubiquinone oxidoreductase subunit 4 (subunit M)
VFNKIVFLICAVTVTAFAAVSAFAAVTAVTAFAVTAFAASASAYAFLIFVPRLHLALGLDSMLGLVLLTLAIFPLIMMLISTSTGLLMFAALEVFILGALLVLDLLGFYILFEASLILLFLLIARQPYGSMEAAYKIVMYTMVGSLLLLPNIFLVDSECGTTNLLWAVSSVERQNFLGCGMLSVFSVKIPLMPGHLWLPEAHVAAPTAGSVLLAGILLKLGGIGFIRFMIPLTPALTLNATPIITSVCLVSFLFSTLSTIRQIDLKTIVAYSSIAHMSVVTLAIFAQSELSADAATLMMLAHCLVSPGLFLLVGLLVFWTLNRVVHGVSGLTSNSLTDLSRTEYTIVYTLMVGVAWLGVSPMPAPGVRPQPWVYRRTMPTGTAPVQLSVGLGGYEFR